jgi:hypothetical protein
MWDSVMLNALLGLVGMVGGMWCLLGLLIKMHISGLLLLLLMLVLLLWCEPTHIRGWIERIVHITIIIIVVVTRTIVLLLP